MPDDENVDNEAANLAIDPWLESDLESRALEKAEIIEALHSKPILSQWDRRALEDLSLEDWLITPQSEEDYQLPRSAGNFVGAQLINELADIFATVREVNNQLAGVRISHAEAILGGDDRVDEVERRLRTWANQYVQLRLAKTAFRQRGPFRQFTAIWEELTAELSAIAYRQGTANKCFLHEFAGYLPTLLYEKTIRPLVQIAFDRRQLVCGFRVPGAKDRYEAICIAALIKHYQWQDLDSLAQVVAMAAQSLPPANHQLYEESEIRHRLHLLVANIQEMRPFIRPNFRPEQVMLEMAPGLLISWKWTAKDAVGTILIAPTAEAMARHQRNHTSNLSLQLRYDGLLTNGYASWIDTANIASRHENAWQVNLRIVEAIHDSLYRIYEKVDVEAILSRFRSRTQVSQTEEPTEEEFAASLQTIAEPMEDLAGPGSTDQSLREAFPAAFRAVRLQRLLTVLVDRLHCEVRHGKGSETVVYRFGGHHFRLGNHKGNNYVPIAVIKNLLKQVGITFDEWLRAIS